MAREIRLWAICLVLPLILLGLLLLWDAYDHHVPAEGRKLVGTWVCGEIRLDLRPRRSAFLGSTKDRMGQGIRWNADGTTLMLEYPDEEATHWTTYRMGYQLDGESLQIQDAEGILGCAPLHWARR